MLVYKKYKDFDQERNYLLKEIRDFLSIEIKDLSIFHIYIFENEDLEGKISKDIFDFRYGDLVDLPGHAIIVKDNEGQYNQVEDLTQKFVNKILNIDTNLRYAKGYTFDLDNQKDIETIMDYLVNPVVQKTIDISDIHFDYESSNDDEIKEVEGFIDFDEEELKDYKNSFGLDLDDLKFIQDYFKKENRNPRYCELKMLDTYWSDHCRHTTFLTNIEDIEIQEGRYKDLIEKSFDSYLQTRKEVYTDREKAISLMDLATINMKDLKKKNILTDMEVSDEVNACSIEVDIEVDGKKERWLHMFKNETHNHPTEIEPYGGAHTCIGGGIRDPLSGRAQVIQGIRLVGAGNPLTRHGQGIEGKLDQRYLAHMAMNGFSDYANQIGSPVGLVREFYDDGFQAKRMELGALSAAVAKKNVKRENAIKGDLILLLGAPTGRDGLGAAVGSSSVQTEKSLTKAGAEVQKGNPFEERKIIRLFNNEKATALIKKSNDFGAGGVSVAIGELADGLEINLDEVYTKYPGLNGYEIALSESQERMAVVIAEKDLDEFATYCKEEDLRFALVAKVTDDNRLRMYDKGKLIIDLSRDLLNSNGAKKYADVLVETDEKENIIPEEIDRLNRAITPNLSQNFDSSLGRNKVFCEYGGKNQLTQQMATVVKFPVEKTNAVSVMSYGYFPQIAKKSAYHGGYYACLQAIVNNIAITGKYEDIRLTMQEFFPSIKDDPKRMGLPFAALLGAFEVMKSLDIPAIGGKDSMSGSFDQIDVAPTLVTFAVNTSTIDLVVSRELKKTNSKLVLTRIDVDEDGMVDFSQFKEVMKNYSSLLNDHKVLAASSVSEYGLEFTLDDMSLGNAISYQLIEDLEDDFLPGNIVFEVQEDLEVDDRYFKTIGKTGERHDISDLANDRMKEILRVYDDPIEMAKNEIETRPLSQLEDVKLTNKKVLIPVVEGNVSEDDLKRAMEAEGFEVEQFIVEQSSYEGYQASLDDLAEKIGHVSIFALAHGDYTASVIKNISGLMRFILEDQRIKKALEQLLARKGFIIGIGAGMSSLIDAGYFGEIQDDLFFVNNPDNKYISAMQEVKVLGKSHLSDGVYEYSAPISGRMTKLYCKNLEKIQDKVDILAINKFKLLENESGIDSIQTKCGHVIGIRSLIDRMGQDLYKNIEIIGYPQHFKVLRKNFI
ncbi:MAG: phosphoribosylformylglycinamidine synthase subunit PurQ [Tissierellia bacterium]|nr:phosphoribosylformylglycinamidine synthase subunit PurQ [Tissierellia bacterium]